MATTGKFEFDTSEFGSFEASELDLSEVGNFFQVKVGKPTGAKFHTSLSMNIEKFEGTKTFEDAQLPVIKFISREENYMFRYTVKSGSLTATISAEAVKITGTFDLIMTADPDSESRGPEEIVLYEGDFELEN
ncbi:hypothetical protein HXW87_18570 [Pseudomonas sp. Y5-11]|jgi:hypothetical protein|uniref:hypothetical protein n=1 Tax=unclassified Pseudomonas TaxID=196821 RepID=UPI0015FD35A4|nr:MULTISPECIES: hypothetical protein [unclassified Pseudomonas]MBA5978826.1 hypothetical protein [Pseudomonas sp. MD195_PC81_125]MBA5983774.1 hypothetical protein [Pseudomonas sp. MD195_PC81_125]ULN84101.1 hypothetical protein HXW87_18570 [Pseudomonas sp. Y5-11]